MRYISLLLLPLLVTACGGYQNIKQESLQGKTYYMEDPEIGGFYQQTFEDFAREWATSDGSKPVTGIRPAESFDKATLEPFHPNHKVAKDMKAFLASYGLKQVTKKDAADYDVSFSGGWGMKHHALAVTQYRLKYSGYFEIRQRAKAEKPVMSVAYCDASTASKYGYDEVFANKGAAIREASSQLADDCTKELTGKLRNKF